MSIFEFGPTAAKAEPEIVIFIRPFLVQNRNYLAWTLSIIFANYQWTIEYVLGDVPMTLGYHFRDMLVLELLTLDQAFKKRAKKAAVLLAGPFLWSGENKRWSEW